MTPDQLAVVLGLVHLPGRAKPAKTPADVLEFFGADDGKALGLHLLGEAVARRSSDDVEGALVVSTTFGFGPDHRPLLCELAEADWHVSHEDVVRYLGRYQGSKVVDALARATWWVPAYLEFDEFHGLARKAMWELSKQPGAAARAALTGVAETGPEVLRDEARQLLRRGS